MYNRFRALDLIKKTKRNNKIASVESLNEKPIEECTSTSDEGFQVVSYRKTRNEKKQSDNNIRLWFFGNTLAFVPHVCS